MKENEINISRSYELGDDIGDIEIKMGGEGDTQSDGGGSPSDTGNQDQDGQDQDGQDQDGQDQDGQDQDGQDQDEQDQDSEDDSTPPSPPPPIEEFEIQSLTFLYNNIYEGRNSNVDYDYLIHNSNIYRTYLFLLGISNESYLENGTWLVKSNLDRLETEMGQLTQEIVDSVKEIDRKYLEYLIINLKINKDYYKKDGFFRYMYDKYRYLLLSVSDNGSFEFTINDNDRYKIAKANDKGNEFIFMFYDFRLQLIGSCKLYIDDERKEVIFIPKTIIDYENIILSQAIADLKFQIFQTGSLSITNKFSSDITKEFLYYINLVN